MNTWLRNELGISCHHTSDYQFEALFKNIKDNIDAGYDTEHTAERAEALNKFGLTDDLKFGGYESV